MHLVFIERPKELLINLKNNSKLVISDERVEEYFPNVVKQYTDYGAILLKQEYRYGHDFYAHLVSLEKGI